MKSKASFTILAASVLIGSWASTSHAQGDATVTTTQSAAPMTAEQKELFKPNRPLLLAGSVAFLGGYVPSMFVAGLSPHDGDKHLWIPVVGPWMDLGDRPMCNTPGGTQSCGTETFNDIMLIVDGVAQAAGVAGVVASFFIPEERKVSTVTGKLAPQKQFQIHFSPASIARGAPGIAAIGTW